MFPCVYACVLKLVLLISEVLLKFYCDLFYCEAHSDAKSLHQALSSMPGAPAATALQCVCVSLGALQLWQGPVVYGWMDMEGWACTGLFHLPFPWKAGLIFLTALKMNA